MIYIKNLKTIKKSEKTAQQKHLTNERREISRLYEVRKDGSNSQPSSLQGKAERIFFIRTVMLNKFSTSPSRLSLQKPT